MTTMIPSTVPAGQQLALVYDVALRPGAAARALAAVTFPLVPSTRRCECGHACKHGSRCPDCGTRRRHVQRRPAVAGQKVLTRWVETYLCDTCGTLVEATVDRPDLPWGTHLGPQMVQVFDGVATGQFDDDITVADTVLSFEPEPDTNSPVQIPQAPRPMPPLPAKYWGLT